MRIVMVADGLGGAYGQERVVAHSAGLLQKAGHDVRFIAAALGPYVPPSSGLLPVPGLYQKHWLTPKAEMAPYFEKLQTFLLESRPDVVHLISMPEARVADWIARRYPTLITAHLVSLTCPASHRLTNDNQICRKKSGWACLVHNRSYGCLSFLKTDLHRAHAIRGYRLMRSAMRDVPVAAVSHYVASALTDDGWRASLVHYVPNPVSVPKQVPPLSDKPASLIVAASRLVALKGIDVLLRAVSQAQGHDPHLWICGDGPERGKLEALAKELSLGERVKFLGICSPEDTIRYLANADVVAQPNLGPETFGMAAAEASALGRPVLASDIPALNEILVKDETAILTPPGSVEALAAGLTKLLGSPELREKLGAAGRKRIAAEYTSETHLAAQLAAYEAARASWRKS